ncbi:alkaline phosphatase family protein, partial [Acinetobacter baumannii]
MDVHQNVYLNNVLKRAGYITETEDGLDYKAYVQSLGLGAYVYIKDHDSVIKKEVMTLLRSVMQDPTYGIETI